MAQQILVVEDDPHFGRQLVDLFEFQGYEVELAICARDALSIFAATNIDLVLTDLMLPEIGGVDLIKMLRSRPGGDDVPVVMMSAVYKNPRLFERELRALGVFEFLPKPFSLIDLGRKIDAILDRSLSLENSDARVTMTGSWRLEDINAALGDGDIGFAAVGSFDRRSLLNLLIDIFRKHSGGMLTLRKGKLERRLYFLNGYPVWATSDEETERLGEVMVRLNLISRDQLQAALSRAVRDGTRFREALIRAGYIDERRLFNAERERVRRVVVQSFAWADGAYEFSNGDDFVDEVGIFEVNPVRCLTAAVDRFLSVNELAPDIQHRSPHEFLQGSRYRRLVPYLDIPAELDGLTSCLDSGVTVSALFRRFGTAQEALIKTLWLMFGLGIADSLPPAVEDLPLGRAEVAAEPAYAPPPPEFLPPAEAPDDHGSRFIATLADIEVVEDEEDDDELSEAAQRVVRDYIARMGVNYYRFLGLDAKATHAEIEAAAQGLRQAWDVGRLGSTTPSEIHSKAKALVDRVDVAWRTLSDAQGRSAYDRRLAVLDSGEFAVASQVETLQDAQAAANEERWADAEGLLRKLAARNPDAIDVLTLLGRAVHALAEGDAARLKEARDWLRKAQGQDPLHLPTLRSLAEVLRDLGDMDGFKLTAATIRAVDRTDPWLILELARRRAASD